MKKITEINIVPMIFLILHKTNEKCHVQNAKNIRSEIMNLKVALSI